MLGLPAGAGPVEPGAGRHAGPSSAIASARCACLCNEGLSGLVAEQLLPVAVADAREHPRYKYFKESGEEEYHSFLGVPLIDRGVLQGVLVVQTKEPRVFREHEIRMLVRGGEPGSAGGERGADPRPLHRPGAGEAVGTGAQRVVELGPRMREPVSRPESRALARS